jgi:hypothetical protein
MRDQCSDAFPNKLLGCAARAERMGRRIAILVTRHLKLDERRRNNKPFPRSLAITFPRRQAPRS